MKSLAMAGQLNTVYSNRGSQMNKSYSIGSTAEMMKMNGGKIVSNSFTLVPEAKKRRAQNMSVHLLKE